MTPVAKPWKHEAMNTVFSLYFCDPQPVSAAAIAGMCFEEIDRLESLLSRYQPDSDISRINALATGESLLVDPATHQLLLIALEMHERTGGIFDITLGHLTNNSKTPSEDPGTNAIEGGFSINPDRPQVTCIKHGRALDLGGIGKGFALDCAAQILKSLDVQSALLSAGASTHLAIGKSTWELTLIGDSKTRKLNLSAAALSTSGTAFQGSHVVHPELVSSKAYPWQRIWAIAPTGAEADAFSTACLILDTEQLLELHAMEQSRMRIFIQNQMGDIDELLKDSVQ
jgi:thiamine biosynthesis lipoprotein